MKALSLVIISVSPWLIYFSLNKQPNTDQRILCDCKQIYCGEPDTIIIPETNVLDSIDSVGPFAEGTASLEKDIGQLKKLADTLLLNNYTEIYLFGGVDKRPLIKQAAKDYGDNLNLAQARANVVKAFIYKYLKTKNKVEPIIFVYPHGANHQGKVDALTLEKDRYVIVYGKRVKNKANGRQNKI